MNDEATSVVYCTVVYNPLDPLERTTTPLVWEHGRTLGDYLDGLPDTVEWAVCVNAEPVTRDEWGATILSPNDFITLVPEVQRGGGGGGGGKNVMRLVAMIAVAVIAAYAAPAALGAMGMGVGSAAEVAAGAAMFEAGSFAATAATAIMGTAISCRGGFVCGALGGRE